MPPDIRARSWMGFDADFSRKLAARGWVGVTLPARFGGAELDAFFFHEYGLPRDDVEHVMDSFWIVRDRDVKAHGSYQTKDAIVAIYDEMAVARRTRTRYRTRLDPPPGDDRVRHPSRSTR